MAKETKTQKAIREHLERQAAYEASRVPATIADVRSVAMLVRSEMMVLADMRKTHIDNLEWLARELTREAEYLKAEPERRPNTSILSGSLPHSIEEYANHLSGRGRLLEQFVRQLAREGVTLPGITVAE